MIGDVHESFFSLSLSLSLSLFSSFGAYPIFLFLDVDSFHPRAHPNLHTTELHGYLRALICLTCRNEYSRAAFQKQLAALNPAWADYLAEVLASGALDTENPAERRKRGLHTNPDGDVDIPNAPYTTFRYPPCPVCLDGRSKNEKGEPVRVQVDRDGAWAQESNGGILKPAVIMFGESISTDVKNEAEISVDNAQKLLVVGSSLATYSAWRLVKRAKEQGKPIAVVNIGGVRGEESFFDSVSWDSDGSEGLRCNESANIVLPALVNILNEQ
jgi:NAD+-dependent protein deacetylase sirtuin 4